MTAVQVSAGQEGEGAGDQTGYAREAVGHAARPADRAGEQGGRCQKTLPPPGGVPVPSGQERLVPLSLLGVVCAPSPVQLVQFCRVVLVLFHQESVVPLLFLSVVCTRSPVQFSVVLSCCASSDSNPVFTRTVGRRLFCCV